MPRFYFNLYDREDALDDGTECIDLAEARRQAIQVALRMLLVDTGIWTGEKREVFIRDRNNVVLETIIFSARCDKSLSR